MLALTFLVALLSMHDVGFTPKERSSMMTEMRSIVKSSLDHGFRIPPVRWVMLGGLFAGGVGIYAFYAMQPYLLQLYGKKESYAMAGLAAAIVAGTQIIGGAIVPHVARIFRRRTSLLLVGSIVSTAALALIGLAPSFRVALTLLAVWALVFAATGPVREAFINDLIPSEERATILSTDNLLGSSGGVVFQPVLGKVADAWSYSTSYIVGAGVQLLSVPFILLARREKAPSDPLRKS